MSPRRAGPRKALNGIILILATALVLVIAEFSGWLYLRRSADGPRPFLIDRGSAESQLKAFQQGWGDELVVSYVDPFLAFAHDPSRHPLFKELPGFAVYGNAQLGDADALLIVCLGGSTTDPLTPLFLDPDQRDAADPYNWPRSLAQRLVQNGRRVVVLNGGVAGYNSNQELLKLLRDVLPMKPDVVLTMDGVNEFQGHRIERYPMHHPYHGSLSRIAKPASPLLMPNALGAITLAFARSRGRVTGFTLGVPNSRSSTDQWAANVRSAHSVCVEFDVQFVTYLQPVLGVGQHAASPAMQELLNERGDKYFESMTAFYAEAQTTCDRFQYCTNLVDVFADESDVYLDARHQNEHGVIVLADAVLRDLQKRGIL